MAQAAVERRVFRLSVDEETVVAAGVGALSEAPRAAGGTAYIVHEEALSAEAARLARILEARGVEVLGAVAGGGERVKSLDWVTRLWDLMLQAGVERSTTVYIIGGGALLDAAGFAASTLMRGLSTVNIPSTTLAAFDAAAGGKTGVNLRGKNMVGTFHNPRMVLVEPGIVAGQPDEGYRDGFAELVKHVALSGDREPAASLLPQALARRPAPLARLAFWSLGYKMQVVAGDPRERGLRRILNLGHTIGHALEAASSYTLSHGRSVSIGLAGELELSRRLAGLPRGEAEDVLDMLSTAGLPLEPPPGLAGEAAGLVGLDKKREGGSIVMPLLERLGRPRLSRVPVETVSRLMVELWGGG
ncbi:3-dehydroquinate synthase [Aeropyrum pernix K1]|uniref:3-dehydroquinate synthase n=1 Tax=Aeropyrum pernix (strain ATCC 700893 / DSM 11879 / JCM 9820 / NBRC 100138 / K1) TaxID=272557 RepID=AROB_AERPE|nr:3-dehydroquinate synthase [Aeropyrum pernix]Q9YEJ9.1 RecName: Full=3-dehydroquinate synthase; Short=DHQS [Aeropyrum pernix K1]BAA79547.1 3-dehydroquinate synthase [Aeropyrum pernix K1]